MFFSCAVEPLVGIYTYIHMHAPPSLPPFQRNTTQHPPAPQNNTTQHNTRSPVCHNPTPQAVPCEAKLAKLERESEEFVKEVGAPYEKSMHHPCASNAPQRPNSLTHPIQPPPTPIQLAALWAGVDKASPQQQSAKFSVGFDTPAAAAGGLGAVIPGECANAGALADGW